MGRKENSIRVVAGEVEVTRRKNQRIIEPSTSISVSPEHDGDGTGETHVGTAGDFLKLTERARDGHVHNFKNNLGLKPFGPDQVIIIANNFNQQPMDEFFQEVIVDETW